ncbi:MAG TPA: dienelactone hydrolase family protein [Gemmatimonadales bacterium]|nr:dienelactone hydrolase family protein [Gemmatimonadales bacterium]
MPRDPHRDQPILLGGAPLAEATGALVLLHGRGGSAQDMLALARDLQPSGPAGLAWLVPEAAGRLWYPFSLLEKVERNRPALNSALALVKRVMEKIAAANVAPERVVLLGFSQGASVALEFAARNARRYGGLIALSGALLGPEGTPRDYAGSLAGTPLFLGCGDSDPHLPKRRVDETATVFERLGAVVTKRVYPGLGHAMSPEEIAVARGMVEAVESGG